MEAVDCEFVKALAAALDTVEPFATLKDDEIRMTTISPAGEITVSTRTADSPETVRLLSLADTLSAQDPYPTMLYPANGRRNAPVFHDLRWIVTRDDNLAHFSTALVQSVFDRSINDSIQCTMPVLKAVNAQKDTLILNIVLYNIEAMVYHNVPPPDRLEVYNLWRFSSHEREEVGKFVLETTRRGRTGPNGVNRNLVFYRNGCVAGKGDFVRTRNATNARHTCISTPDFQSNIGAIIRGIVPGATDLELLFPFPFNCNPKDANAVGGTFEDFAILTHAPQVFHRLAMERRTFDHMLVSPRIHVNKPVMLIQPSLVPVCIENETRAVRLTEFVHDCRELGWTLRVTPLHMVWRPHRTISMTEPDQELLAIVLQPHGTLPNRMIELTIVIHRQEEGSKKWQLQIHFNLLLGSSSYVVCDHDAEGNFSRASLSKDIVTFVRVAMNHYNKDQRPLPECAIEFLRKRAVVHLDETTDLVGLRMCEVEEEVSAIATAACATFKNLDYWKRADEARAALKKRLPSCAKTKSDRLVKPVKWMTDPSLVTQSTLPATAVRKEPINRARFAELHDEKRKTELAATPVHRRVKGCHWQGCKEGPVIEKQSHWLEMICKDGHALKYHEICLMKKKPEYAAFAEDDARKAWETLHCVECEAVLVRVNMRMCVHKKSVCKTRPVAAAAAASSVAGVADVPAAPDTPTVVATAAAAAAATVVAPPPPPYRPLRTASSTNKQRQATDNPNLSTNPIHSRVKNTDAYFPDVAVPRTKTRRVRKRPAQRAVPLAVFIETSDIRQPPSLGSDGIIVTKPDSVIDKSYLDGYVQGDVPLAEPSQNTSDTQLIARAEEPVDSKEIPAASHSFFSTPVDSTIVHGTGEEDPYYGDVRFQAVPFHGPSSVEVVYDAARRTYHLF